MLAEKDQLLRKSLDKIEQWEQKFAKLRQDQAPLLFQS
jgi:hypothetical protein